MGIPIFLSFAPRWFLRVPTIYVLSKNKKNNRTFSTEYFSFYILHVLVKIALFLFGWNRRSHYLLVKFQRKFPIENHDLVKSKATNSQKRDKLRQESSDPLVKKDWIPDDARKVQFI